MSIEWCKDSLNINPSATIYKNGSTKLLHLNKSALKALGIEIKGQVLFGYDKSENLLALRLSDDLQEGTRKISNLGNVSIAGVLKHFKLEGVFNKYPAEMKDEYLIIDLNNPIIKSG